MTFEETRAILKIVKAEWPQSFRGMTKEDAEARINLWAEMFKDDDPRLVGAAVKALIVAGNREFAPGVGQIKEQMRKLTVTGGEKTEAEAWARIRKAIRNSGYDYEAEFKRLPPVLQKLVGSASQLHEWAMMDSEELNTVVASNVQRAYRTVKAREDEHAKLPREVRALIAGYTEGKSLERNHEQNLCLPVLHEQ